MRPFFEVCPLEEGSLSLDNQQSYRGNFLTTNLHPTPGRKGGA